MIVSLPTPDGPLMITSRDPGCPSSVSGSVMRAPSGRRPADVSPARRLSSTDSSAGGSGASARTSLALEGDTSSSRHAWRNSRSRPSGPRREVPVP